MEKASNRSVLSYGDEDSTTAKKPYNWKNIQNTAHFRILQVRRIASRSALNLNKCLSDVLLLARGHHMDVCHLCHSRSVAVAVDKRERSTATRYSGAMLRPDIAYGASR